MSFTYKKKKNFKNKVNTINTQKKISTPFPLKIITTWKEIEEKIINVYKIPNTFKSFETYNKLENDIIKKLIDINIKHYNKVKKEDLKNTLLFLYQRYKTFIFITIRNNKVSGYYFYNNLHFKNDWGKYLKTENGENVLDFIKDKVKKTRDNINKEDLDIENWYSNNCVLETKNWFNVEDLKKQTYINQIIEMLNKTIEIYKNVPDCDFIYNRRDFPLIRKDNYESFSNLYNEPKIIDENLKPKNMWPLCSQSKTKYHLDIVIPNSDDWDGLKKDKLYINVEWKNKIETLFWRGSSTGCSTNIIDNPRLYFCNLDHIINYNKYNKEEKLIDLKITKLTNKLKVNKSIISKLDIHKIPYNVNSKHFFINSENYSKYKYLLNIEGNVSAYRLGHLFTTKSLIINVKSDYYVWFEPLLKLNTNYINIEKNIHSNELRNKIIYLKKNDDYIKTIATNGYNFYKKYININTICKYWYYLLISINNLQIKK